MQGLDLPPFPDSRPKAGHSSRVSTRERHRRKPRARSLGGCGLDWHHDFLPWNVKLCVWLPVTALEVEVMVTDPPAAIVESWLAVSVTI